MTVPVRDLLSFNVLVEREFKLELFNHLRLERLKSVPVPPVYPPFLVYMSLIENVNFKSKLPI